MCFMLCFARTSQFSRQITGLMEVDHGDLAVVICMNKVEAVGIFISSPQEFLLNCPLLSAPSVLLGHTHFLCLSWRLSHKHC